MSRTNLNTSITLAGSRRVELLDLSSQQLLSSYDEPVNPANSYYEYRNSVSTPGFRAQRKDLESLPFNRFSYEKWKWSVPHGRKVYERPGNNTVQRFFGDNVGGSFETDPLNAIDDGQRSACDAVARQKVLLKLKDQKVNLGVLLLERDKTLRMFADITKRIATAIDLGRKGNWSAAFQYLGGTRSDVGKRKLSKSLADDFLVMRYGLGPLLQDIRGSAETLAGHASRHARLKVSASHTVHWDIRSASAMTWDGVPCNPRKRGRYTSKYVIVFGSSSEFVTDLASVGITNPVSWIWEMTPWSFVADWVVGVGDWIDSLDATLGLSFEKGCNTTFEKGTTNYNCFGMSRDSSGTNFVDAKASTFRVRNERYPLVDFPSPPLPIVNPALSAGRFANAVALAVQRLPKEVTNGRKK